MRSIDYLEIEATQGEGSCGYGLWRSKNDQLSVSGQAFQGVAKDDQFSDNRKVFASSGLPKVTNFRV